jgi:drug/metabolite transporter (DMT)-like permease
MRQDHAAISGSLLALVAASMFGTLGPLSRFAADAGLGALGFVAWRAGIGALVLALGIAATGGARASIGSLRGLDGEGRRTLGVAALMGCTLNIAIFIAFGRITIALALMLFYTYPAIVAVVSVATGRETLTRARLFALLLASAGVALVLLGGLGTSGGIRIDVLGVALAFSAALSQTVFITISRTGYRSVPPESATLVILVGSALGALAAALVAGSLGDLATPGTAADAWPFILVAGVFAAAIPSVLFLSSIRRIGGTRTGILMLWEPVVGVVLAALLLHEALVPAQLLGGVFVLGAAFMLQVSSDAANEPVAGVVEVV